MRHLLQSHPVEPDRHLVERISEGDGEAMLELEARHGLTLYAVAYNELLDPEAADEAVSLALMRLRRVAPALRFNHGTIFEWLVGEVHRRAYALAPDRSWVGGAQRPRFAPALQA